MARTITAPGITPILWNRFKVLAKQDCYPTANHAARAVFEAGVQALEDEAKAKAAAPKESGGKKKATKKKAAKKKAKKKTGKKAR